MADAITFDVTDHIDGFNKLASDMPFLISKTMNDVAFKDARGDLSKSMADSLIIRNKGIASKFMFQVIKRSNKNDLEVIMIHKVPGIGLQQRGGVETPKSKKIAIPHRKNMSRYMNVSEKKNIPKKLRIQAIMSKAPRSRSESIYNVNGKKVFILPNGVFIRIGKDLKAVYYFVDQAVHTEKGFHFQKTMVKSYNRRFTKRFNVNYIKELRKI